jgi:small subunit ribosomal protein S8e
VFYNEQFITTWFPITQVRPYFVIVGALTIPFSLLFIGISRSSRHKRSASGAQRAHYRKKRKFELGRQSANTKLGAKRIHTVRVRGGNHKHRALRLDSGNFAWGSEHVTRKTRIISVVRILFRYSLSDPNDYGYLEKVYNASNNELVRTNTLVKGAVIQVDATPFRVWYEAHVCLFHSV